MKWHLKRLLLAAMATGALLAGLIVAAPTTSGAATPTTATWAELPQATPNFILPFYPIPPPKPRHPRQRRTLQPQQHRGLRSKFQPTNHVYVAAAPGKYMSEDQHKAVRQVQGVGKTVAR